MSHQRRYDEEGPPEKVKFQDVIDFYEIVDESALRRKMGGFFTLTVGNDGEIEVSITNDNNRYGFEGYGGKVMIERMDDPESWSIRRADGDGSEILPELVLGDDGWPLLAKS